MKRRSRRRPSQSKEAKVHEKKKNPGWVKMITQAIGTWGDQSSKSNISDYIKTKYPDTQFKIVTGRKFDRILINNLNNMCNYDEDNDRYQLKPNATKTKNGKKKSKAKKPTTSPAQAYIVISDEDTEEERKNNSNNNNNDNKIANIDVSVPNFPTGDFGDEHFSKDEYIESIMLYWKMQRADAKNLVKQGSIRYGVTAMMTNVDISRGIVIAVQNEHSQQSPQLFPYIYSSNHMNNVSKAAPNCVFKTISNSVYVIATCDIDEDKQIISHNDESASMSPIRSQTTELKTVPVLQTISSNVHVHVPQQSTPHNKNTHNNNNIIININTQSPSRKRKNETNYDCAPATKKQRVDNPPNNNQENDEIEPFYVLTLNRFRVEIKNILNAQQTCTPNQKKENISTVKKIKNEMNSLKTERDEIIKAISDLNCNLMWDFNLKHKQQMDKYKQQIEEYKYQQRMEVQEWLDNNDFAEYFDIFMKTGIDCMAELLCLTEEKMMAIQFKMGKTCDDHSTAERKHILYEVAQILK